jgi:multiple sugar transport system permease protein
LTVASESATRSGLTALPVPARHRSGLARREARTGLLYISPWLFGLLTLTLLPMLASLALSFTDFDPRDPAATQFVGLANYERMVRGLLGLPGGDPLLGHALFVTVRFAVLVIPATVGFALLVAMLVNSNLLPGRNLFRTLFYMPMQIPIVASTLIWIGMLNASTGWFNQLLAAVGIQGPDWINSADWVSPSLVIMGLWGIGNMMLIFLAGLQGVPSELYDSAKVDGAGPWHTFRHITLPMISTVMFYNLIITLIGTFQYFTQAYILGNGRGDPANQTLFFNLHLYREGWAFYSMGYACALAWLLFVIVLLLTTGLFRTARSWVYEAGGDR